MRPQTVLGLVGRTGALALLHRLHPQAAAVTEAIVLAVTLPPALWRRKVRCFSGRHVTP